MGEPVGVAPLPSVTAALMMAERVTVREPLSLRVVLRMEARASGRMEVESKGVTAAMVAEDREAPGEGVV